MRQGSNGRQPHGRPQRNQHGGAPRQGNFDSSGPEGRIRGNAHQVYEKYIGLARDAATAGDRIAAETYYQYAEHYYRIVNVRTDPKPDGDGQSGRRGGNGQAETVAEATPGNTGAQPLKAPRAEGQSTPQKRRRPRQAKPADPQPNPQPKVQPSSDAQSNEDGEPTET
jgi:hypothetical protein